MATRVPVKSILKQQPQHSKPTPANEEKAKAERDSHNYNIALQHAYRIQHQKDWQAAIISSIETLLDYPSGSAISPEEATKFIKSVQHFQPGDLDALVEERRIDGRCGYTLCTNPPRAVTVVKGSEWKLGKGAADFCSNECARKSAYVKAQLSEVPAWERGPGFRMRILLPESDQFVNDATTAGPKMVGGKQSVADDLKELALERGEKPTSFKPKQVMTDKIVEKPLTTHKPLSSVHDATVSHTAIEGYEPRVKLKGKGGEWGDDSDEEDEEGHHAEDDDEDD